jgi:hypothetical protein
MMKKICLSGSEYNEPERSNEMSGLDVGVKIMAMLYKTTLCQCAHQPVPGKETKAE